jgi:hypothetical protein
VTTPPPAVVSVTGHADADEREVARRDLGAPLEPALADHPEQLLAGRQHRADGCAACRDHAVVGRQHGRLGDPQLARAGGGTLRVEARLRGPLGRSCTARSRRR